MQGISLNFHSDSLFALADKIKSSVEGRIGWGDTFGTALDLEGTKHLIVWTPKGTAKGHVLPGFDSKDGQLALKIKPRPGAWVSWIDETKVHDEALDDYDRVHKSVLELERNTRQITDFADGVLTNITVQHLGKSLTLSDLIEEVLTLRLRVPNNMKTGGYILAKTADNGCPQAKVIIPEQTYIQQVHLNEDVMFTEVENAEYNTVFVVLRTHTRTYPDLLDLEYSLTLRDRLLGKDASATAPAVRVLPTAAVYNPLEPKTLRLVPIEFTAPTPEIGAAISDSLNRIDIYTLKATQHIQQLIEQFQLGVENRLKALMLNRRRRVHNKVWDDLAIRELHNTVNAFVDFYSQYLNEHFDAETTHTTIDALKQSIDPIIELWQLQENQQFTLNNFIQSTYILANQVLDKASALFYDLVFETNFIATGLAKKIDLEIYENGTALDALYLPEWTSGTVQERMARIGLRSTLHAIQIDRLRAIWIAFLEIANFASQHKQDFEKVIQPLVEILLAMKPATASARNRQVNRQNQPKFPGFELAEAEFEELLTHVKQNYPTVKRWIEQAPRGVADKLQPYYTTLWTLILNGKLREKLLADFQPTCDINLSVPEQTKRLINLTLGSQLVVGCEKDRKTLERNLHRALLAKTGHSLREVTTAEMLAIHGDVTLALLREELVRYNEMLTKRANRLTNPARKGKKRNRSQTPRTGNGAVTPEAIQAEQTKVSEMIAFLEPYGQSEVIATLANAGLEHQATELEEIRKQQVLSFDISELPAIGETWLTDVKTLADYPNLRTFLLQNKLPISTTGSILMELRGILSDSLFDQVLVLIQEVRALQHNDYKGEPLAQFVAYISEKLWRWELTQITPEELPIIVKEKALASVICYEKEVETLMEYVERYEELLQTKLDADSEIHGQREMLENRFQEIVETLL